MEENRALVIDNGSGFLKAGFAGDREPSLVIPNIMGVKKRTCRVSVKQFAIVSKNKQSKLMKFEKIIQFVNF